MPICTKCLLDLPIYAFGIDKDRATGRRTYCRKCRFLPRRQRTLAEVFWKYVDTTSTPDGCWLWQGKISRSGYGQMRFGTQHLVASRVAYQLQHGTIPEGMLVCHHCDTPSCCRVDHLFIGTPRDNTHDAMRKGRLRSGNVKLTEDIVRWIRQLQPPVRYAKIGRQLGVTNTLVRYVYIRKIWKHVE